MACEPYKSGDGFWAMFMDVVASDSDGLISMPVVAAL